MRPKLDPTLPPLQDTILICLPSLHPRLKWHLASYDYLNTPHKQQAGQRSWRTEVGNLECSCVPVCSSTTQRDNDAKKTDKTTPKWFQHNMSHSSDLQSLLHPPCSAWRSLSWNAKMIDHWLTETSPRSILLTAGCIWRGGIFMQCSYFRSLCSHPVYRHLIFVDERLEKNPSSIKWQFFNRSCSSRVPVGLEVYHARISKLMK